VAAMLETWAEAQRRWADLEQIFASPAAGPLELEGIQKGCNFD